MHRFVPLLIALALAATAAPAPAASNAPFVDDAAAPYIVYLGNCTGTLIAPDRVLTAAHCAPFINPDGGNVVIGTNDVGGNQGFIDGVLTPVIPPASAVYPIKGVVSHPRFTLQFPFAHKKPQNATADNDIAYVVLARPVTGITPIPIATPVDAAALDRPGGDVTLLGYGETQPRSVSASADPGPTRLHGGDLSLIAGATCERAYPGAVRPAFEICAQDLSTGPVVQPCAGDSGGPLIAHGPDGPVQIGVTSWGSEVFNDDCGQARLPAVWMRVSHYASFLTDPTPTFEPHTTRRAAVRRREDGTLTCTAPHFKGSAARVSYQWGISNFDIPLSTNLPNPLTPLRGATSRRFARTRATRGKKIACAVTARNAGGSWTVYSPSVRG